MENQTKYLFYGLSRNSQNPLDSRFTISSLSNIINELPINNRYKGLIFYITDIQKHYLFLDDLNNPFPLQQLLTNSQINGITSSNYVNLITDLNNTNPNIGSLVTVYPLGVTFIFDGTWKYFNGEYIGTTLTEIVSIPNLLKQSNKLINIGTTKYAFNNDLTISTEIIILSNQPTIIENNRYYQINGILYIGLNSILYKLSEKYLLLNDYNLIIGNNLINHTFNSSYVCGIIWINNVIAGINEIIPLKIKIVGANKIHIESQYNVTGNILLTSNL